MVIVACHTLATTSVAGNGCEGRCLAIRWVSGVVTGWAPIPQGVTSTLQTQSLLPRSSRPFHAGLLDLSQVWPLGLRINERNCYSECVVFLPVFCLRSLVGPFGSQILSPSLLSLPGNIEQMNTASRGAKVRPEPKSQLCHDCLWWQEPVSLPICKTGMWIPSYVFIFYL